MFDKEFVKKIKDQSFSVVLSLGVAWLIYTDGKKEQAVMRSDIKTLQQKVAECYEKRIQEKLTANNR